MDARVGVRGCSYLFQRKVKSTTSKNTGTGLNMEVADRDKDYAWMVSESRRESVDFCGVCSNPHNGDLQCPPGQAVVSKDVVLDPDKKTWLRIYRPTKLPSNDKSVVRLPIMIYFHGGGWFIFSPDSIMVHENCNLFSSEVPAIVISVGYRLAPESRLPAQYEDAVDAILWVKKQALDPNGDQWLKSYGDFSRCYLYGSSNGGNIVFHAALRTLDLELSPLRFVGLIMNQPMFGAKQRTNSELKLATDDYLPLPALDLLWELALPPGIDRDHRFSNPFVDGPYREKIKSLVRCLVIGFNGDPMFDRQQDFVQMLILQGVLVEAHFDVIGFHGVDLIDSRRAAAVLSIVKEFI